MCMTPIASIISDIIPHDSKPNTGVCMLVYVYKKYIHVVNGYR